MTETPPISSPQSASPQPSATGYEVRTLVWKGESAGDPRLFYATFNGTTWTGQQVVPGAGSSAGPVACGAAAGAALLDTMWLMWKGEGSDTGIYFSASFQGGAWGSQDQIAGAATNVRPALASYDIRLFVAWTDASTNAIYWGEVSQITAPPPPLMTQAFTAIWNTPAGTPLGGSVTLMASNDGAYTVEFRTQSGSILTPFDFQVRAYLTAPNAPTLFFGHQGHVSGDGTDDTHAEPGSSVFLQLYWNEYMTSGIFSVSKDYEWSGVTGALHNMVTELIEVASGAVGAAIGLVIGMTSEAIGWLHAALGPGVTIGVIASVAVFVCGASLGLPVGSAMVLGTVAGVAAGAVSSALI